MADVTKINGYNIKDATARSEAASNTNRKLDKNQGAANSGKILGVNATGEVEPTDTEVATLVDVPNGIVKGDGSTLSAAEAGTDYMAPDGDGSNVTAAFTAASSRTNIATGEKLSVLFGKIAKWFSDLGSLAFKSSVAKTDLEQTVQSSLDLADTALQSLPSHNHDASAIDSGILPVIRGGTGVSSLDELATALGAARIQMGSYTGTGTSGRLNKRSLTFDFEPKFLIIVEEGSHPTHSGYVWLWAGQPSPEHSNTFDWTISGKTITWWYNNKDSAREALNESERNYYWVAMS